MKSPEIALGESAKMSASEQVRLLGEAWERTAKDPDLQMRAVVYRTDGTRDVLHLGAHAPNLSPDDVELVHRLWLECVRAGSLRVHHRDVVAVALRDFEARLEGSERESLLARMRDQTEAQDRRPA